MMKSAAIPVTLALACLVGSQEARSGVILHDRFDQLTPAGDQIVAEGDGFTSNALVGGTIDYIVSNGSVTINRIDSIIFFGGAETEGEIYMTFDSLVGTAYEVTFDTLLFGAPPTGHTIQVSAVNGDSLRGAVLARSARTGIDSTGSLYFVAATGRTTIGITGAVDNLNNGDADIAIDNLRIAVPEPASLPLLTVGFAGLLAGIRRRVKLR